jgi:hypothetical protein
MDQRIHWWWNGTYGRLVRRDVAIFRDEDQDAYRVEARDGGVESTKVRKWETRVLGDALALAEDLMSEDRDQWRDMIT